MALLPLKLFSKKTSLNFMNKKWIGFALSIGLTLLSIGIIASKGLNLGIDFTGGILMEIRANQDVDLSPLRSELGKGGYGEITLQHFGTKRDVIIRIQT